MRVSATTTWLGRQHGKTRIRDRAAGWKAALGDGTVRLSDDDSYALAGPYRKNAFDEPAPAHRKALERLRWDDPGNVDALTLRAGEPTDILAAGRWPYAYRDGDTAAVARTCDDVVIGRLPFTDGMTLSLSPSEHFFSVSLREGRAIYRVPPG